MPTSAELIELRFSDSAFQPVEEMAHGRAVRFTPRLNFHDGVLRHFACRLAIHAAGAQQGGPLHREELQLSVITYLLDTFAEQWQKRPLLSGGLSGLLLRRCTDYIEDNLHDEISLDGLASMASISKFHLLRSFKLSTGCTPHEFVIARRIERAKRMIRDGQGCSLMQVALACGFANEGHVSRTFRRRVGLAPREFRSHAQADRQAFSFWPSAVFESQRTQATPRLSINRLDECVAL